MGIGSSDDIALPRHIALQLKIKLLLQHMQHTDALKVGHAQALLTTCVEAGRVTS